MTETEQEKSEQLVWIKVGGDGGDIENVRNALEGELPDGYRAVVADKNLELADAQELMDSLGRQIADG